MQDAGSYSGGRGSPDITQFPFTFTGSKNRVGAGGGGGCGLGLVSPMGSGNSVGSGMGVGQSINSISEVPHGMYEFIVGEGGEVRILCKICQYISNKKSNFKRHFTNMHFVPSDDGMKQLECCGIRFSTKGEKFQHTKSVHKYGYKCGICGKVFDRPALLQRHLAKHTGKKPYKCSLCTYQTPNKANAKRHIEKKHSDVQEGSILFVTDDGEQIQMEIVSKSGKGTGDVGPTPKTVVKSSADSSTTAFGFPGEMGGSPIPSCFKLPRYPPPSATVTSSSSTSSPENSGSNNGDPLLASIFGPGVFRNLESKDNKKRHISHSIQRIISEEGKSSSSVGVGAETMHGGSEASSLANPEHNHNPNNVPSYLPGYDHPAISQWYPANWSHTSSPLPVNININGSGGGGGDYTAAVRHGFLPQGIVSASSSLSSPTNQGSPLVFQCIHGCWHHVHDNHQAQASSNSSPNFSAFLPRPQSTSTPILNGMLASPDLRLSSSLSQQTENSSVLSVRSEDDEEEDEDDSEIIDVVDCNDDEEEDTGRLHLLSTICEGLGSCTTAEIRNNNNEGDKEKKEMAGQGETQSGPKGHGHGPPVDLTRRASVGSVRDAEDEDEEEWEAYVPKKLRVSRAFRSK